MILRKRLKKSAAVTNTAKLRDAVGVISVHFHSESRTRISCDNCSVKNKVNGKITTTRFHFLGFDFIIFMD